MDAMNNRCVGGNDLWVHGYCITGAMLAILEMCWDRKDFLNFFKLGDNDIHGPKSYHKSSNREGISIHTNTMSVCQASSQHNNW